MSDILKLNDIVTKLSRLDKVESVYASSRAGVFTVGSTPNMTDRSMFSAITSMMLGAAEQLGREMGEDLDHVLLKLNRTNLLILGAGPKHIIGIEISPDVDSKTIIAEAKKIMASGS